MVWGRLVMENMWFVIVLQIMLGRMGLVWRDLVWNLKMSITYQVGSMQGVDRQEDPNIV